MAYTLTNTDNNIIIAARERQRYAEESLGKIFSGS
jgi:hypothetical protein